MDFMNGIPKCHLFSSFHHGVEWTFCSPYSPHQFHHYLNKQRAKTFGLEKPKYEKQENLLTLTVNSLLTLTDRWNLPICQLSHI